jgi:hypothetical protein
MVVGCGEKKNSLFPSFIFAFRRFFFPFVYTVSIYIINSYIILTEYFNIDKVMSFMVRNVWSYVGKLQRRTFAKGPIVKKSHGWEHLKWLLGFAITAPYIGYCLKDRVQFHNDRREEIEIERLESARIKAEIEKWEEMERQREERGK